MPPKRESQRRNLTYQEKLTIIRKKEEEPSWTQENLAMWAREQFKLATKPTQATISNILRAKQRLQSMNVPPDFRSARPVKNPELDALMIQWVATMLANNSPLTREAIQQKAAQLAQELQLANAMTFSKGWVSSFMKRHQLHFRRKHGLTAGADADLEVVRQNMLSSAQASAALMAQAAGISAAGAAVSDMMSGIPTGNGGALDGSSAAGAAEDQNRRPPRLSTKRKRMTVWEGEHLTPETRVALGVLLEWVTVPGNYARWRMRKSTKDKEPLCEEINLLLRTRGLRDMTTTEIRVHLVTFVKSFKAATSWLTETGLRDAFEMEKATGGYDVKSHVLQLCQHYDALAPVLTAFLDDVDEDEEMGLADEGDLLNMAAAAAAASIGGVNASVDDASASAAVPVSVTDKTALVAAAMAAAQQQALAKMPRIAVVETDGVLKPPTQPPPQSATPDRPADKQQQQLLFDLECEKLKCDIEAKHVQLMLEKTLARKKLLDAGIPTSEVDKIFPL
jgi:hypothetical protein